MTTRANVSESRFPLALLSTCLVIYGAFLAVGVSIPWIGGSSEAREAQVIDVILRDGDWLLPRRNGLIPSKPPLFHWAGAVISVLCGGVSEATTRFTSVMFGIGSLFFTGLIAFRLSSVCWSRNVSRHAASCALLAPAILSLTYGFHHMATQTMVDMSYCFFICAALAAVVSADPDFWSFEGRLSSRSYASFWIACSGAILARGPIGFVLPLVLVGTSATWVFGWRRVLRAAIVPSWGMTALAVPLAWYAAAWWLGGKAFVERQLLFENLRRITGGAHMNSEAWWYYIPSLLRTTFPWGIMLVVLLLIYIRAPRREYGSDDASERGFVVPLISVIAGVVLFSIASGKRHSYMLPLYPLIATQTAMCMLDTLQSLPAYQRIRVQKGVFVLRMAIGVLACFLLGIGGLAAAPELMPGTISPEVRQALHGASLPVGFLLFCSIVQCFFRATSYPFAAIFALWIGAMSGVTAITSAGAHIKSELKGFPFFADAVKRNLNPGEEIAVRKEPFDEYFDPILYYLHRPVRLIHNGDAALECRQGVLYLTRSEFLDLERKHLPGTVRIISKLHEPGESILKRESREITLYRCIPEFREMGE